MSRIARLKEKMINREKIIGTNLSFAYSELVRAINVPELDFIAFDFEHGAYNLEGVIPLLRLCRDLDLPSIVRVQDAIYHLIAKPVDYGADCIQIPRTETMEQVEIGVKSMWFKPTGYKGLNGILLREDESFADIYNICNNRLLVPQIESPEGVDILPEMFERYDDKIHGVIIGPGDMSVAVGTPTRLDSPEERAQIDRALKICDQYKKTCGIYCGNADDAQKWYERGMNLLWTASEMSFMQEGYRRAMKQMLDAARK